MVYRSIVATIVTRQQAADWIGRTDNRFQVANVEFNKCLILVFSKHIFLLSFICILFFSPFYSLIFKKKTFCLHWRHIQALWNGARFFLRTLKNTGISPIALHWASLYPQKRGPLTKSLFSNHFSWQLSLDIFFDPRLGASSY